MIGDMSSLSKMQDIRTRSVSPENFTGEKGAGGQATEGTGASCARDLGRGWKVSPSVQIEPGQTFTLADIKGQGMVKHIWVTTSSMQNRILVLRMYWDNREFPSVEAPLGDFFASADEQQYEQLTSLAVCVNPRRGLNCYWDMPFYEGCRMTLENLAEEPVIVYYQIDYQLRELEEGHGYFHAQYRRTNPLPYKEDYTVLDGVKGKGQYVGTYMFWGVNNNGWWGEGEIKFFMDGDREYPTICGTGTEDYFCGAYDFEVDGVYRPYCTPYAGLSKITNTDGAYKTQQRFSMYRWHITDPVYFDEDLKVTIQALGWRSGGRYLPLQDDISSVAYWYQDRPVPSGSVLGSRDDMEII